MAETPEMPPIDLPNPKIAALLAWLVPGLGHLYQGRRAKGFLFMGSIIGLFVAGMWIGGGQVVYASTLPVQPLRSYLYDGWPFLCQSGIGAVAIPGWIERSRYQANKDALLVPAFYPPQGADRARRDGAESTTDQSDNRVVHPDGAAKRRYRLGFRFEVGMVYTVIAGLLNLLVVYDAHSGPLLPEEEEKNEPNDDPDNASP
ncbi:hypothetical protein MalM25_32910 [Planctomycetes bacterium MalM25]|nr:hypothetical protein MalM25_32910 [Planctomycetes bacterium MalM25]